MSSSIPVSDTQGQQKLQDAVSDSPLFAARCATTTSLMESLLHDARNPLNALSINLEVMSERMRRQAELMMPAYEKNLRVMREQILRVDAILRSFAEFIAPSPAQGEEIELSQRVLKATEVLSHECRKHRITLRPMVDAGVKVALRDSGAASFVALQPVYRAIRRSVEGSEISVMLRQEGGFAVLHVSDTNPSRDEPTPETVPALDRLCREHKGRLDVQAGECFVFLPLA
ncbi:MAG: histidine kinase [Myxococcaceae bacterium]